MIKSYLHSPPCLSCINTQDTAPKQPKGGQIFVRWMDAEGATTQITRVEETPRDITWSPDSRSIAFTMLVPDEKRWPIKLPARPEGAQWTTQPRIIERLVYRYAEDLASAN